MNLILLESDRDYWSVRSIRFYTNKNYHNFGPISKEDDNGFSCGFKYKFNWSHELESHGFYIEQQ